MSEANRLRVAGIVALTLAVVATACGGGGGKTAKPKKVVTTTTTAPKPVAPLTGLPDPTGVAQTRPALWVKIENLPVARPQSGLDVADVVYEIIVNGGITRFAAVFQSTGADSIGPIRSVRPMDPSIVQPLAGIFAYSGGLADEVAAIKAVPSLNVIDESDAGNAMYRISSRSAPHNLYGHTDALWAKGGAPKPPPPLFGYLGTGATCAGDPVTSFTIPFDNTYGQPTYTWDAVSRTWRRAYGGTPHTMLDGQQIAPQNVIVQFVQYTPQPGVDGGNATLTGQGDAWVLCGGNVVKGHWTRTDPSKPTQFVNAAGTPVRLTPGRTWVELVQAGTTIPVVSPPPVATTVPPAASTSTTVKKKK